MDEYLIYLRKSRKDRDMELATGKTDTLERHRRALLELAAKLHLAVAGIYEEVVSGDTIAERPEMQKLLAAVETEKYAGVLVMEIPRLARGNTRDQGIVAETFQYSNTKIITPDKIYDPSDEADEEYFEFGLFLSRREYKAINRRLQRGRMASFHEGKYIGGTAPYGYEKYKLSGQKGYSLRIVPNQAEVVRHIFRLYTAGDPQPDGSCRAVGSSVISGLLNAEAVPAPGGGSWSAGAVRDILRNPTYAGFLRWSYRPGTKRMESGRVMESHPISKDACITRGLHEPIIPPEVFQAAQSILEARRHAPVPGGRTAANPLAGLLRCSVCGRSLVRLPQSGKSGSLLLCPTPGCPTVGSRADVVEAALLDCLRQWLAAYRIDSSAVRPDSEDAADAAERTLARLETMLGSINSQRGSLCDLLEQGVYTKEFFSERSRLLAERAGETEKAVEQARVNLTKEREAIARRKNLPLRVDNLLERYELIRDPALKNALWKEILDHVVYAKSVGGRYGKSDLKLYVFPRVPSSAPHL